MLRDRENLSSVLDSAPQKSISLAKIFKNVFNNCKNAGLCNVHLGIFLLCLILEFFRGLLVTFAVLKCSAALVGSL
jgi:hypothetical protein